MPILRRTRLEARRDKFAEVRRAEAAGEVADSLAVRTALIERMKAGELTPEAMAAELKRIQKAARANGQITRKQAYRRG